MQTKRSEIIEVLLDKLKDFNFRVELVYSEIDDEMKIVTRTKDADVVKTYKGLELDSEIPATIDAETAEARADFIWGDGNRVYLSDDESIPYNSIFQVSFMFPKHKGIDSIRVAEDFSETLNLGYIDGNIKDVTIFDKSIYGYMIDDETEKAVTVASFTIKTI